PQLQEGNGLLVLKAQGLGADHLGAGEPRPLLPADGAEGHVGDPRHRGQGQGRFDFDSSNGYHINTIRRSGPLAVPPPSLSFLWSKPVHCITPPQPLTRAAADIKIKVMLHAKESEELP